MKRVFILIACFALLLCGCSGSNREYYDDIFLELDDREAEIVIREWSFLLGSSAEIYYKEGKKETLLGNTTGADDGFCPFKDGLYSIEVMDDTLTIEWCSKPALDVWKSASFTLPSD